MPAPKEKWKKVKGYPNYEVSNLGRVRSLGTTVNAMRNGVPLKSYVVPGRVLKQARSGPYRTVSLCREAVKYTKYVHVLVARAFKGKRPNGLVVRHLDGVGTNNVATNIEYGTYVENGADASKHGTTLQGTRHPKAKLCKDDVLFIKRKFKRGHSKFGVKGMSDRFNVSPSLIQNIISGRAWSWLHQSS